MRPPLKRVNKQMHSQQMALIVLTVIGCIDYLAYDTFFTCAIFYLEKVDVFFPAKRAQDERWEEGVISYLISQVVLFRGLPPVGLSRHIKILLE